MKQVYVVSLDEEFEKSRVKAHVRTRKGKLERVQEFERKGSEVIQKVGPNRDKISDKRIRNILSALPELNLKTVSIINLGFGDKPQLEFTGEYKGFGVKYRTQTPGGGPSSVRINIGKGGMKAHKKRVHHSLGWSDVKQIPSSLGWKTFYNTPLIGNRFWMKRLDKVLEKVR